MICDIRVDMMTISSYAHSQHAAGFEGGILWMCVRRTEKNE